MKYGNTHSKQKPNGSNNSQSTHIFLADHNGQVRSALHLLLNQQPEIVVVGEAWNAEGLLQSITAARPDLVLLEWQLPGDEQGKLVSELQNLDFEPAVVVLSSRPEERTNALECGADAFVDKGQPPQILMITLYQTMRGAI